MPLTREPYRYFFPVGLLFGVIGAAVWIRFGFDLWGDYPGRLHADLMIGGFLLAFVTGFLMTAVPNFTGTPAARRNEILLLFTLCFLAFVAGAFPSPLAVPVFHVLSLLQLVALGYFSIARFLKRQRRQPELFSFIAVGLICGIAGAGSLLLSDLGHGGRWETLGRALYYHSALLAFVLGVGSKLLPMLLGWDEARKVKRGEMLTLASIFLASPFIEAFASVEAGRTLRAVVAGWIALSMWRLHRQPPRRAKLTFWLWCSAWSLIVGLIVSAALPAFHIHAIHITLVSGLSLMTLLVASRVTLSHGGFGVSMEKTSKRFKWVSLLIFAAMLARVVAPLTPQIYARHLGYASMLWLIGLVAWAWAFLPKMFVVPSSSEEDC